MPLIDLDIPSFTMHKGIGVVEECAAPDAWPVVLRRRGLLRRPRLELADHDGGLSVLDAAARPRLERTVRVLGGFFSELTLTVAPPGSAPAGEVHVTVTELAEAAASGDLPPGRVHHMAWAPPPERRAAPDVRGDAAVDAAWERIEAWFAAHVPGGSGVFAPGAGDGEIAEAERRIGVPFPDALRRSLRRHDGLDPDAPFVAEGTWLLSAAEMAEDHAEMKDIVERDGLGDDMWRASWVPIARNDTGGRLHVDVETGEVFDTDSDSDERTTSAPRFEAWLTLWADELEAGEQAIDPDGNGVVMAWLLREDR